MRRILINNNLTYRCLVADIPDPAVKEGGLAEGRRHVARVFHVKLRVGLLAAAVGQHRRGRPLPLYRRVVKVVEAASGAAVQAWQVSWNKYMDLDVHNNLYVYILFINTYVCVNEQGDELTRTK